MKIYVLAAGYATRLHPLTRDMPKPLLDVAGEPILTRILGRLLDLDDVTQVVLVSNARFAERFRAWARDFGGARPIVVLDDGSTDERNRLGAVGDLAFALERVPNVGEEFVVVAGDNLLEFDPRPAQRAFRGQGRSMLVVRAVDDPEALRPYNEVTLDAGGIVTSFREKPQAPRSNLAAIALYFFTPEVAPLIRRYLDAGGNPDAPGHFVSWLVERVPVAATRLAGRWFDIGSLDTLAAARAWYAGEDG